MCKLLLTVGEGLVNPPWVDVFALKARIVKIIVCFSIGLLLKLLDDLFRFLRFLPFLEIPHYEIT